MTPSVTYAGYPNTIDRFGGFAKFEFKPVDGLYLDALVSRYTQEDKELRYQQILTMRGTQTASGAGVAFPQGQALIRYNDFFIQKPVVTAQTHLRWDIARRSTAPAHPHRHARPRTPRRQRHPAAR